MTARTPLAHIVVQAILIAGSIVFLFPLFWMISTSLKPIEETMTMPPRLLPSVAHWGNYFQAVTYESNKLGYVPFLEYALNTLTLCALGVLGTVISNAIVAYGFARIV